MTVTMLHCYHSTIARKDVKRGMNFGGAGCGWKDGSGGLDRPSLLCGAHSSFGAAASSRRARGNCEGMNHPKTGGHMRAAVVIGLYALRGSSPGLNTSRRWALYLLRRCLHGM